MDTAHETPSDEIPAAPDLEDPIAWTVYYWDREGLPPTPTWAAMGSLLRIHQVVTTRMQSVLKAMDLGLNQYLALMSLLLSKTGGRRLNRLGRHMMVHPTTVTVLIDQLEQRGFVRREQHGRDRRAIVAIITPSGRSKARAACAALMEIDFGLTASSPASLNALTQLLHEIG